MREERIELEREVLEKTGYLGMDFLDVIKVHFAYLLNPEGSDVPCMSNP